MKRILTSIVLVKVRCACPHLLHYYYVPHASTCVQLADSALKVNPDTHCGRNMHVTNR